jgi:hypothetical protein
MNTIVTNGAITRMNLAGRTVQITDTGHVFYGMFVLVLEDFGDALKCRPVNSQDKLNLAPGQVQRVVRS